MIVKKTVAVDARRTAALVATVAAVCVAATVPSVADAAWVTWTQGIVPPQGQMAGPTQSQLRSVATSGYDWVGAGAHLPGGWTMYGSYITGFQHACHDYAAGNSLGPMAKNDSGLYNDFISSAYEAVSPSC